MFERKKILVLFVLSLLILLPGKVNYVAAEDFITQEDMEVINQIKNNGLGRRFAIAQIQPMPEHKALEFQSITFTGPSSLKGKLSRTVDGRTMAGNEQIICFTDKTIFLNEVISMGPQKIYLPKNIKGFVFESQLDNPLKFILLANKGLVYICGIGSVIFPDGKTIKLPEEITKE